MEQLTMSNELTVMLEAFQSSAIILLAITLIIQAWVIRHLSDVIKEKEMNLTEVKPSHIEWKK